MLKVDRDPMQEINAKHDRCTLKHAYRGSPEKTLRFQESDANLWRNILVCFIFLHCITCLISRA